MRVRKFLSDHEAPNASFKLLLLRRMFFFEKAKLSRFFVFSLECDALSRSIINDRRAHQNTAKLVTGWFVAFVGSFGVGG